MGCYSPCVAAYAFKRQPPNPIPQLRITQACSACQRRDVSHEGKYLFSISWSRSVWGRGCIHIRAFVEHFPSRAAPWGKAIDDGWWSVLHSHSGRPPRLPLPPCHPPNGENAKAWYWISDGYINLNEWSHSWATSKSISSMEKTIADGGNGEKRPLSLEIEKLALKGWKRKTMRTQIQVNEWYCINNIKFWFVNVKN